jgi:hypothetical protein
MLRRQLLPLAEKLELHPRSAMLNARRRPVRELGSFLFAALMLSSVRRNKWLISRGILPPTRITTRAPQPVTDKDIALCERLIKAYALATKHLAADERTEGMWSWIFDVRQQGLARSLAEGDARALATLMASMFQQDFVLGMAPGPLVTQSASRFPTRAWGVKCLDGVVSLGEVLGVVPVENPEQGKAGAAFGRGLPGLFDSIEGALGFPLDFPDVGAPAGLGVGDRLITPDTPDQLYAALRLRDALDLHLPGSAGPSVVEIGGGYGGMCLWFLRCRPDTGRYTIVDLPIVNAIQGYFLGRVLGGEKVAYYGENDDRRVRVVPDSALAEEANPFDVLVNKDSLPEMPQEVMENYLRWGAHNCTGFFYSQNQETSMTFLDEPQGIVHDAIRSLGGFTRVRRDRAWVRDGYVEEIYLPA